MCRREIEEGPHVIWYDNYNKMYNKQLVSMSRDVLKLCNWTGRAVRPYLGTQPVSMKVKRSRGEIVPAMPQLSELWEFTEVIDRAIIKQTGSTIEDSDSQQIPTDFLDSSFYVLYGASRVPLKPDENKVPEEYKEALRHSPDTLENFHPAGLIEQNIGSNEGLARVIRQLYDEKNMGSVLGASHYVALNVDCNIFSRLMKVHASTQCMSRLVLSVLRLDRVAMTRRFAICDTTSMKRRCANYI